MSFKDFDIFGWKVGIYHRLFLYSFPLGLFFIYFSNTRTIGLIIFFMGIPLFWNLRGRELRKQQAMIEEYRKYRENSGNLTGDSGWAAWTRNFYHQNPEGRNPWSNSEEE